MLILAVFLGTGAYSQGLDTIAPHVTIAGIDVGGMSREAAADKLDAQNYEKAADDAVSIVLSDHISIEVTRAEAGLFLTAEDAVNKAFQHGKDGNIFSNGFSFLKSFFSETDITEDNMANFDEDGVRQLISKLVDEANSSALENAYIIKDSAMLITKGVSDVLVDEKEIYDIVYKAFDDSNFEPIHYDANKAEFIPLDLAAVHDAVFAEPINASYNKENGSIQESVVGIDFDVDLAQSIYDEADEGETVSVPLTITEPSVTSEELKEALFRDVLAEKSTSMSSSSSNRINNISLAAAAINGTVLNPGETFSFNDTVGQRTTAKGYKEAGAYVSGESVNQVGGGICQVSSTIYYCVLHSDLEVAERRNHMFSVSYLPLGMDATVNWGTIDFKFKNNTDYPLKIVSYVSGKTLYVQLVGTKATKDYVKIEYVVVDTLGYKTVEKDDNSLAPGTTKVKTSGHGGYVVDTYKYSYDGDGNLKSKDYITRSTYRSQDRVILVGPKVQEPEPTPTPNPDPTPEPEPEPEPTPNPDPPATDSGNTGEGENAA